MKVLVATRNTQGQRGNDFCFVPEGEIVAFPAAECTGEKIDGSCGCRRSVNYPPPEGRGHVRSRDANSKVTG